MKKTIILSSIILASLNANAAFYALLSNNNYTIETKSEEIINCSLNSDDRRFMYNLEFSNEENCNNLILKSLNQADIINISNSRLINIDLDKLRFSNGININSNNSKTLKLTTLDSVFNYDFEITSNELTSLNLSNLRFLNKNLYLNTYKLNSLNLEKLLTVETLDISKTKITDISSIFNLKTGVIKLNKDLVNVYPDYSSDFCQNYKLGDVVVLDQNDEAVTNVCE